jgi:hypothetical protein
MSENALKYVYDRLGRKNTRNAGWKAMKLCYSNKRDGWSASTFHNKCNGRGPLLLVARMNTGRVFVWSSFLVFRCCTRSAIGSPHVWCGCSIADRLHHHTTAPLKGGYQHSSMNSGGGWTSCGRNGQGGVVTSSGWLFRVNPSNKDKTDIYHHTGNRPAQYCYYRSSSYIMTWGGGHDLSCEQSFNHCYNNPYNYGSPSGHSNTDMAGRSSWKKGDMSDYEVYLLN